MPILEARHELAHPVEEDSAWSESYYFNAYDPGTDSGFFTRIGIRPNEGTMDVAVSAWLPDGRLAEYRRVKEQHEMVDTVLDVGGARYEMLAALGQWRLTMDDLAPVRDLTTGERQGDVQLALDVRFDAVTPAIGTDGQRGADGNAGRPKSAQAVAAAGTVGKGHFEQAGRWTGWLAVDGVRSPVDRCPRPPRQVLGPTPVGRSQHVAMVQHQRRGRSAFRRDPPRHRSRRPPPRLGVGRGLGHQRGRVAACARNWRRTP